ncbi:LrgB family protein [Bacillus sp. 31A1R]|uniref:LrgB family protein n=1 Tax=Robertmurraya mangrovi TaxID=3098077 RepID=A0ABU5J537_9BACI|nr:LrgB family protein [Bacillus sp. 31A1R]MDZ5474522.1 LrgB family protein [Bacillus sp. 31A1R]
MNLLITIYSLVVTILVYLVSRKVAQKFPSPFTTPVFLSTTLIIVILLFSHITYEEYAIAKDIMTYLLGPATVALAVPLYKHRFIVLNNLIPAIIGLTVGSISTILVAIMLAKWFHLKELILASMSIKSITIPVAAEVSKIIGADAVLVAGFVMITGMCGAMFGPPIMNMLRIKHPFARGLSMGTIAHGIGTAEVAKEGELQGAVAGIAMGLAAVFTSLVIPFLLPVLLKW